MMRILFVIAVVLLMVGGCRTSAQKAEDLRADTILKQSADLSRQPTYQRVDGGIGP